VVALTGFYFFNRRVIVRPLTAAINHIEEASNRSANTAALISSASQSLAEGASEQAAALQQTGASLEEMSSMTKRNAESAEKANDLAQQARTAGDTGTVNMQAMNEAMDAIQVSSDDIGKIIKTIDEIAFQTNILALNAAVEAARAGEAGLGFAIVADEVRNLAQRCAQAAKETTGKIEGAAANAKQGSELSAKVTRGLQEIVVKVRQVDEIAGEVATASKEQNLGISQVNAAVSQVDKVTQANAAAAEESASAAMELTSQAEVLNGAVAELFKLVNGVQPKLSQEFHAPPRISNGKGLPESKSKGRCPANGGASGVFPRNGVARAAAATPPDCVRPDLESV
jgi:methyl-accepting chemotaxis protein